MTHYMRKLHLQWEANAMPLRHRYEEFGNGGITLNDSSDEYLKTRANWNAALDLLGATVTLSFDSLTPGASDAYIRTRQRPARLANAILLNTTATYQSQQREGDDISTRRINQLELLEGACLTSAQGLDLYHREQPATIQQVLADIAKVVVGHEVREQADPVGLVRPEHFAPFSAVCADLGTKALLHEQLWQS